MTEQEFDNLHGEMFSKLYGYLINSGLQSSDADYLTQEALLRLHEHLVLRGRSIDDPKAYAYRMCRNLSLQLKGRRVREPSFTPEEMLEPRYDSGYWCVQADHAELRELVKQLPQRNREVIILRYWQELGVKQSATILHIAESEVSKREAEGCMILSEWLEAIVLRITGIPSLIKNHKRQSKSTADAEQQWNVTKGSSEQVEQDSESRGHGGIKGLARGIKAQEFGVAVYVDNESWCMQPQLRASYADIDKGGRFKAATRIAPAYAAILVRMAHQLPSTMDYFPAIDNNVLAVTWRRADKSVPDDPAADSGSDSPNLSVGKEIRSGGNTKMSDSQEFRRLNCCDVQDNLLSYIGRILETDTMSQIDAHLALCRYCQGQLGKTERLMALVREAKPIEPVMSPDSIEQRLQDLKGKIGNSPVFTEIPSSDEYQRPVLTLSSLRQEGVQKIQTVSAWISETVSNLKEQARWAQQRQADVIFSAANEDSLGAVTLNSLGQPHGPVGLTVIQPPIIDAEGHFTMQLQAPLGFTGSVALVELDLEDHGLLQIGSFTVSARNAISVLVDVGWLDLRTDLSLPLTMVNVTLGLPVGTLAAVGPCEDS